jgi:alpha-L-fucosidase
LKKLFVLFLLVSTKIFCQPKPTAAQLAWHKMEYYFFMHFGPNTFTGKEWGLGTEPADAFNPTALNCNQWASTAKQAGATAIIITAKHHDGFCLWPSKYSTHTVRQSKWKNGHGDVLKELSKACKAYGLKFGVYLSPWDRNHPDYGTDKYNDVFANMLTEIFTSYGHITELWWDGANGEGPNGKKQMYDFDRYKKLIKKLSPQTVVFSDIGPHIRWVGNEQGIAGTTNWNMLDTAGFSAGIGAPPTDTLTTGNYNGKHWIPAECDVSIRPGWFYINTDDAKVKAPEQLFNLYLKSVGRGANLLLNIPPNMQGLIHPIDSTNLINFKKLRSINFKTNLLSTPINYTYKNKLQQYTITLPKATAINCLQLIENIQAGQTIRNFTIELYKQQELIKTIQGTSIGNKRILSFTAETIDNIKIYIHNQLQPKRLTSIKAFLISNNLIEK